MLLIISGIFSSIDGFSMNFFGSESTPIYGFRAFYATIVLFGVSGWLILLIGLILIIVIIIKLKKMK